jgi:exodeoxyribonuclease VII small subunit
LICTGQNHAILKEKFGMLPERRYCSRFCCCLYFSSFARKPKAVNFEKALADLERQVLLLESGELSLEDALAAFEAGITLTRDCQQALTEAEQKVQLLLEKADGSVEYANFDLEPGPGSAADNNDDDA